jgi:hypothetical protein
MIYFKIDFFANQIHYTAKVHKIPSDSTLPVEYHVFNIEPEIPKAPRTFMFVYNIKEETFDSTVFNDDSELSQNMFTSIKNYCLQNDIALTT